MHNTTQARAGKSENMKRKTYHNVMRATKMIQAKGYDFQTASDLALRCFENMEHSNNGMPAEWWLDKVISADEYRQAAI